MDKCEKCGKEIAWEGIPKGNKDTMSVYGGSGLFSFKSMSIQCLPCSEIRIQTPQEQ